MLDAVVKVEDLVGFVLWTVGLLTCLFHRSSFAGGVLRKLTTKRGTGATAHGFFWARVFGH